MGIPNIRTWYLSFFRHTGLLVNRGYFTHVHRLLRCRARQKGRHYGLGAPDARCYRIEVTALISDQNTVTSLTAMVKSCAHNPPNLKQSVEQGP